MPIFGDVGAERAVTVVQSNGELTAGAGTTAVVAGNQKEIEVKEGQQKKNKKKKKKPKKKSPHVF